MAENKPLHKQRSRRQRSDADSTAAARAGVVEEQRTKRRRLDATTTAIVHTSKSEPVRISKPKRKLTSIRSCTSYYKNQPC